MADGSVLIDTKLDNKGLEKGLEKISSVAKSALKGVTIAVGGVATAFAGIVTASVKARGELEQQVGGIESIFKDSADVVIKNANKAYKTAGMSAVDYMQTATGFSASLLESLGNDTKKAAEYADRAMTDMSDNANRYGTDISMIQNAYQGFSKANYTMLDNLKLGYAGTKEGMQTLIKQASNMKDIQKELNVTVKDGDMGFANIVNAISVIQKYRDVTGTTAKEASETLQGSLSSMKASWENFLSGSGGITQVIETAKDVTKNIKRITKEAISFIIDEIKQQLLNNGFENIANAIDFIIEKIKSIFEWIATNLPIIIDKVLELYNNIQPYMPILEAIGIAILAIVGAMQLWQIITTAVTTAQTILNAVLNANPISLVVLAIIGLVTAFTILWNKSESFRNFWIGLWENIKEKVNAFVDFFKNFPYNIGYLIGQAIGWFAQLPEKIKQKYNEANQKTEEWIRNMEQKIKEKIPQIVESIKSFFSNLPENMNNIGKNIVEGLWNGIKNATGWIKDKVQNFAKGILDGMKEALGIHSPSRVFRDQVGKFIALGVGEGFTDNIQDVYKDMKTAVDFETQKLSANLSTTAEMNRNFVVNMNVQGDTYLDSEKVGRMTAPAVTRAIRVGGL